MTPHPGIEDEYFGSADGTALSRRSANLWLLLRDDPRYAYYGRLVALSEPAHDSAEILSAMARLQGAAVAYFYPARTANELFADLQATSNVATQSDAP
jgi:hypothetical protein